MFPKYRTPLTKPFLYAIDPGVHFCGVAFFDTARELLCGAEYVPMSTLHHHMRPNVQRDLIVEMPRIYPGSGQRKGDLNDLLDVSMVVGIIKGLVFPTDVELVYPAAWKGQVPKKVMTPRILSKLSEEEKRKIVSVGAKDHNTIDAVGIGLWKLGRL